MTDAPKKMGVLREAGEITLDLLDIGFPAASYDCPVDNGVPQLEEDKRYWDSLEEMRSTLEPFGYVELTRAFDSSSPGCHLKVMRPVADEHFCNFHVSYKASGGGMINVEFTTGDHWLTAVDHHVETLSPLDVGRFIARAELIILMDELESPTETLDYWMVEASNFHNSEFSQSRWAKIRDVSRQSVNNSLQAARKKFEYKSK